MRRAIPITLIVLLLLTAAGYFIGIRWAQSFLIQEAKSFIAESCQGCVLNVGSVSLSPLRRRVVIENIAVVRQGTTTLEAGRVAIEIKITPLFSRVLEISKVIVSNASIYGLQEDSANFELVESILEEDEEPAPFEIELRRLVVNNLSLHDEVAEHRLSLSEINAELRQIDEERYAITAGAGELIIDGETLTRAVLADRVELKADFAPDYYALQQLTIERLTSWLQAALSLEDQMIRGRAQYLIDDSALNLSRYANFTIGGSARVEGPVEEAMVYGQLGLKHDYPGEVLLPEDEVLNIEDLTASFNFSLGDQELRVQEFEVLADSELAEEARGSLREPIIIGEERLRGALQFDILSVQLEGVTLEGVSIDARLGGTTESPVVNVLARIAAVGTDEFELLNLTLEASYQNQNLSIRGNHHGPTGGSINLTGELNTESRGYTGSLNVSELDLASVISPETMDFPGLNALTLDGSMEIEGVLPPEESEATPLKYLNASGELRLLPDFEAELDADILLNGRFSFSTGVLKLDLLEENALMLQGTLVIDTDKETANLSGQINEFELAALLDDHACIGMTSEFHLEAPLQDSVNQLSGHLNFSWLNVGCDELSLQLTEPASVGIEEGVATIESFQLAGAGQRFNLTGQITADEELAVEAQGNIDLRAVADLVPVDDLRGNVRLDGTVSGTFSQPDIRAEATLSDGEVAYDEFDVWIREIEGGAVLRGSIVEIQGVSGRINGGEINAQGRADLEAMTASARVTFEDVFLQPIENSSVLLAGELHLSTLSEQYLLLQGEVFIEEAAYERELDLREIIRELRTRERAGEGLLATTEEDAPEEDGLEIELDITVSAPGEVFVMTNWLGGELEARVNVTGTASQPLIEGEAQTITGWFVIGEHRFEVTSGRIMLQPEEEFPWVEIFSESYVSRTTAEDVLITIEIVGRLPEPEITMSSDIGLSQEEIIQLLTGGRGLTGQAIANVIAEQAGVARIELLEDVPLIDQILQQLQIVDSLTFEPRFNVETGQIEPAVRAEKSVTPRLTLWSETLASEAGQYSRLQADYELTDRIDLSLTLDRETPTDTTPVSLNIVYTFYDREQELLRFEVSGNEELSDEEVRQALFLSPVSRLEVSELRDSLPKRLARAYESEGYFDASFEFECVEQREELCRELHLSIEEGPRSKINEVVFEGDDLRDLIDESQDLPRPDSAASVDTLEWTEERIRERLSDLGYYSSRVRGRFQEIESPNERNLEIIARTGNQMSFEFRGNQRFTRDELMEMVKETAAQITGFNMDRLRMEIVSAYQRAGYPHAEVEIEEERASGREDENIIVMIEEGRLYDQISVRLIGNTLLSDGEVRRQIRRAGQNEFERMFEPNVVFEPEIELNLALIEEAFAEHGFLQTKADYSVDYEPQAPRATIMYHIDEAPRLEATHVEVRGFPEMLDLPKAPQPPHTQGQVNAFMNTLAEVLEGEGFFSVAMGSELDERMERVIIHIDPGVRTHISQIVISGLDDVDDEVVLRALEVSEGEPWRAELIDESRRNLARLGIFSRAQLRPENQRPSGPGETLFVEVYERPLRDLRVGTGLNSEYGVRLFLEGSDRSLFGDGRSLYAIIDTYTSASRQDFQRGIAALRYSDPFFMDTRLRFTEELRYERLDVPTPQWNLDRWSAASYFHRDRERGFEYSFGHSFLNDRIRDVLPDTILSDLDTGTTNISYLSASLRYDDRDDRFYPRRGYLASLDHTLALSALLSDADFYGISGRFSYVYPINEFIPRFSLATNTRIASQWAFSGTDQIPISQRYYLGGRNTVRGFRENSLGPRGELGGIIGGDLLFAQNIELRYERWENFVLHTFLDAGNVFLRSRSIDELRYSTGAGFRFLSPVGPIGFDVGIPLDEKSGEPSFRIHFNIGGTF